MRQLSLLLIGLFLLVDGCSPAPQTKAITLVNAAAVDAELLERVRTFAEKELHVPVRTLEKPALAGKENFQTLEKAALRIKTDADVELIVLAGINGEEKHLAVFEQDGIALINSQSLYTAEAETFARRLERQVMRAAAFTLGMPPTPDPFCVTRDYRSLEELDRMGRNYSPPWMGRFADEAAKRGLEALPVGGSRPDLK
ncbi:MAG: hypothetical protein JEZ10_05955 [Verrucomicrobia bacterium]|nr:hypothetical protein [Verrucomicrobiota bacterium]